MKKVLKNKVLMLSVFLILMIVVTIGVFSLSKGSENEDQSSNLINRTQDEIKTKSNVATTPIVLPKEGQE